MENFLQTEMKKVFSLHQRNWINKSDVQRVTRVSSEFKFSSAILMRIEAMQSRELPWNSKVFRAK